MSARIARIFYFVGTNYTIFYFVGTNSTIFYFVGTNYTILMLPHRFVSGDLTVTGYNIYRDGGLIGTVDSTVTSYTDNNAADGDHTYYVTVVYAQGESDLSNPATPTATGITNVNSGVLYVGSTDGAVVVRNADAPVSIYSLGGELVAAAPAGNAYLPVKQGTYIAKVGGKAFKLIVK